MWLWGLGLWGYGIPLSLRTMINGRFPLGAWGLGFQAAGGLLTRFPNSTLLPFYLRFLTVSATEAQEIGYGFFGSAEP